MQRFSRFVIVLTIWLFPWLTPLSARAQTSAGTAPPPPPARLERGEKQTDYPPPSQKSPLEQPPPPGGEVKNPDLKPAPLEAGDLRFPITLAAALRLADARPIIVTATGASVWVSEANLQKAKVLWIPTLNLGFDYIRHDGYGPDFNRGINVPQGENALGQPSYGNLGHPLNQNINYIYTGPGYSYIPDTPNYFMQATPGPPLLPSPEVQFITDMVFQPLYERQRLNSARWSLQTAKNDALLMTATAYFDVHKNRGKYAGGLYVVERGRQLVQAMRALSKDLVSQVEIERARNLLADLEQRAVSDRQYWRRASADLTRVLRLDPRAVVEPLEHDHLQITLIEPSRSLDDLIPIGLTNRPELASHQALVQATLVAIRREKLRPLMPSLLFNGFQTPYELIEGGALGEGNGGKLNIWNSRDDFSEQVLWKAQSLGLDNLGAIKEQRGNASRRIVELFQIQDNVAAEVTKSQAQLQSAAARVVQAERELKAALANYDGNFKGLKQTRRFGDVLYQIFRPQEVVFALGLLARAYDNYFITVAEYNTAQFQLFHAMGYPAREIAFLRRPGPITTVNTTRPAYLPRVGTGPPPATR